MMPASILTPLLLTLAIALSGAATDIFLPALPNIVADLQTSVSTAQLTIPAFLIGSALTAPLFGALSDSYGRRPLLLSGLCIFLTGSLLCTISPSTTFLLLGRFLQGCGSVAGSVVGWALIYDLYPLEKSARIMSLMSLGTSVMPIFAPVLGGYITVILGWRMIFLLIAMTCLGLLVSFSLRLKQEDKPAPSSFSVYHSLALYRSMLTNRIFLGYILLFPLLLAIEWCWLTVAPFYFIDQLRLNPERFGLWMALTAGGWIAGSFITSLLLARLGMMRAIQTGLILTLLGCVLHLALSILAPLSPGALVSTFTLIGFGTTFVYSPSCAKAFQCFDQARGATSAVRSTTAMTLSSCGGLLASYIGTTSLIPLSFCMLGFACTALSLYRWILKRENAQRTISLTSSLE